MNFLEQPTIFLIFIGFCLAAFAFLFSYLNFPKSFLEDLKKMEGQETTKDRRRVKDKILKFFFAIDFLSWITLLFLLFSILSSIVFLVASLSKYKSPHLWLTPCLNILIIIYIIIMIIVFLKAEHLRRIDWETKSRRAWLVVYYLLISVHGVGSYFFVLRGEVGLVSFFVGMPLMIVVLFSGFVIALARYNPLTELGKYWNLLANTTEDENTYKGIYFYIKTNWIPFLYKKKR